MGRSASAPLAQPSGMASPRSSLDSESGGLPDRLHSALCSGFYRRTSV